MADPNRKKADAAAGAEAKELGISPGIVAGGEMFKQGLIWGSVATAISWFVLAFGRRAPVLNEAGEVLRKGNFIHEAATLITRWHVKLKDGIDWCVNKVGKNVFKQENLHVFKSGKKIEEDVGSAITSTSFIIGGLAGKLALPGAAIHGRARGLEAGRKYAAAKQQYRDVKAENDQLKENNVALAAENQRFRDQLGEKKDASFTDRVKTQSETETVTRTV